ncbi:hypothetical protein G9A89_017882 [Geosiphon pyriformis]|nr:hypothetical protein G9A89_017882 [Geosiphon pyriformis]
MGHLAADCKISPPPTPKVPKVFKSRFVGSASYAKTAAPSSISEFPSLVASSAASAADPIVNSRLDFLEKQISDLAALVKSIVEPVDSLIALMSRLLDDNAIKAVQVEKDIVSMKSAANNFFNLMVGVSKDIACLRFEVDFGDIDYNGVLAAKPSFLSEDTIECVIALWQMSGAETRGNIEGALSVVKATRQNVLEVFSLSSNHDKLPLVATEATFSSLAGFSPVKVSSKRHTWVSPSVVSTSTKSPKVFNNRPVNKLVFPSIDLTPGASSIISSKKMVKKTRSSEKWEQSLASAIVTLNSFVVPNEILDEVSIASSGMSSKMGQDQPLAVLPNVVSSNKSSPVVKAKQSPPIGSPVFENWADQMETDSSFSLVFGATSGGAWETITSHQRFAGWMASTLVPDATFMIKLAHVKTVFQSVHSFLGAKSVSKDNVKLFCMEFASQLSLEAAFLIELTSSVCLTTLKIAKSLVVSESGSSLAAVVLRDVLLDVSAADVKLALSVFGSVTHVVLKPAGIWQYVVVYFEKLDSTVSALKHWSVLVGKNSVRILPLVNQNETILFRDKFKAKLVNLPSGCTAFKISDMIFQIGGRTCFMPWSPDSGHCFWFALVTFDSQGNLDSAVVKTNTLRKCHIWWETPGCWHCFRCQEINHLAADCKISLPFTPKVSKIFKSRFVGSTSYVKTAIPSVASLAASAADLAVRLFGKQISDLAALVKSIVEPVGSLVALVSRLLDDNAAKAVQVEKDLISMKSAANNFSNLLVGVSKNIACLKSEIDFGDMNYEYMLAAKSSILSKDTIECVIALWQMSGAETKSNIESTRLFLTTIGPSIAVLNRFIMKPSFNIGVKSAKSRKKRRGGALEDNIGNRKFAAAKVSSGHSWSSKTSDTTKSNSVDMEEKCLVEETSFDHGDSGAFAGENSEQTPKSSKILTKRVLEKPLGKINFLGNDLDDILLDKSVVLFSPLKNLVNVSLMIVRKLFSKINGFEGASTPSKFAGIVRATFTSELSLAQASKKAEKAKILTVVLKKIPIGTSTEAVCAALSEFGIIKLIKIQLVRLWQKAVVEFKQVKHADLVTAHWFILIGKDAVCIARSDALLYTLPMGTNAHNIWDYVVSVGEKTCVIDHHLVFYARARCATVCFDSAESLDAVIKTMSVLKEANLHWSCLVSTKCAKYRKLGHTSLVCLVGEKKNVSSGAFLCKTLLDLDKNRLAAIYTKCSAPVAHSVSFGGILWAQIANGSSFPPLPVQNVLLKAGFFSEMKPAPLMSLELDNRFAALEHSLTSLAERVDMLANKLKTPEPMNQEADIVISKSSGVVTDGETVVGVVVFNPAVISKMEETLNSLLLMVMNLSAKLNNAGLKVATCNVRGMKNPAKQNDIIYWHKEKNNLVSIFTESKLKGKVCPWIVNKFDGVQVFTSGLESGNLGAGVVVVMNSTLAKHVCKISEVPGRLLSIKLLFRNKLSVSILGVYAGASLVAQFSQASNINSFIAKTVNESSFVILRGDFNEDSSHKCVSFKKCLDFGLVNALGESSSGKLPTWSNFRGIVKTINYVLIFLNLVNAVVGCGAVSVLVGLGGLLDTNKNHWKYDCKGANAIKWTKFKNDTAANLAMFHDKFLTAKMHLDLDAMWAALCKVLCLSAEAVFKKKWFKDYDHVFVKESSKFHKLELLVSKLIKASHLDSFGEFMFLLDKWESLDLVNASVVKSLFLLDSSFNVIRSVLSKIRKSYHSFKILKAEHVRKSKIRSAINKRMKSFELNKGHTIRNILECLFCKVTLDHLVMNDKLVLEPDLVRTKSLEYVFDEAFSGVICSINFDKMSDVISSLLNEKAAGLSDTTTRSSIFAIGSVIEDALEKNHELWLVLQDM